MITLRRLTILALAAGFLGMGLEAYISHQLATDEGEAVQWLPVFFSVVAAVLIVVWPIRVGQPKLYMLLGLLSIAVGLFGTYAHVWPWVQDLSGFELGEFWRALSESDAPPLAPGAFAVLGLALFLLGGEFVTLRWRTRDKD